jgi:hypothetical protein
VAVAFDAFSSVAEGTGTLSWTHTPVGTPKGIRVDIVENGGTNGVTGVTYGGVALELVAANAKTSGEAGTVVTYFLGRNIPTGARTVSVTVSDAVAKRAGAITLTALADTAWIACEQSIGSDSLANPSATINLLGKTCFVSLAGHSGQNAVTGITPSTGWTSRLEHDFGNQTAAWYTYNTIATSNVACGWTQTADDAVMVALAITEAPLVSDTNAVGVTESASITVVFDSRALPIIITEAVTVTVVLAASDSVAVLAQEAPAISVTLSAADSLAAQLSEVGAALFTSTQSISVTDSLAVQATDVVATAQATTSIADTCPIILSDARAVVMADGSLVVEAHDTDSVQAVEVINDILVFIPGSVQNFVVSDSVRVQLNGSGIAQAVVESLAIGLSETSSQTAILATTDSLAILASESSALATDTFFTPTASDSVLAGLTDTAAVLAFTILTVADTVKVQAPEDVPDVATVIAGSDTLLAGFSEPSDQATQFGVLDSVAVQASGEISQISGLLMFSVTDSTATQCSDSAALGTVTANATDSVAARASEVLANSASVSAVDSLEVVASEIVTMFNTYLVAESMRVQAAELAIPVFSDFFSLTATDSCAVKSSEAVTELVSFLLQLTTSDSVVVQVAASSDQAVTLSANDTVAAQESSSLDIFTAPTATDTAVVQVTDLGLAIPIVTVGVSTFASDAISGFSDQAGLSEQDQTVTDDDAVQASEAASASITQPSAETVAALLLEELRLDLSRVLTEQYACGLVESARVSVAQSTEDASAVQAAEASVMQPGYYFDDMCLVGVSEQASDTAVANASQETWNGNTSVEHKEERPHPGRYRIASVHEW